MFEPCFPSSDGTQGRALDGRAFLLRSWIMWIFRDYDIINSILYDFRQEMLKPGELRWKTAMQFFTAGILAFPAFNHNKSPFAVIASHDAGNLIAVFESGAADRAGRFLPITLNEKHRVFRCKQDRNLIR